MANLQLVFSIFLSDSHWTIARVSGEEVRLSAVPHPTDGVPTADLAMAALADAGYQGEGVLMGLPSNWCLSASIDATGLRSRNREATLSFRFEEQLPLALEEIVADFVQNGERAMGVAVQVSRVAPLLDAMEAAGISVIHLCPTALLAAQEICKESFDAVVCFLDDQLNLLLLENSIVRAWALIPGHAASTESHLRQAQIGHSEKLRIAVVGLPSDPPAELLSHQDQVNTEIVRKSSLHLAARQAERVLSGDVLPPVELRRGALVCTDALRKVREPLICAIAGAILFCTVLGISFLWRAAKYSRLAELGHQRQIAAFSQALPQQVPPALIAIRLRSEESRLRGISGLASDYLPSPSILPLLRDTLAAFPGNVRFRLLEMRFNSQEIYIEGQTLDHSDAEQIASDLRKSTGLVVDPPHTQQPTGEDVTFDISAFTPTSAIPTDRKAANP